MKQSIAKKNRKQTEAGDVQNAAPRSRELDEEYEEDIAEEDEAAEEDLDDDEE